MDYSRRIPSPRRARAGFLSGLILLAGIQFSAGIDSPPTLRWRWSNPRPHGNNVVDMLSTNGVLVQVCERGRAYASTDWQSWTPLETGTDRALRAIGFFGGRHVIAGESGTVVLGSPETGFQALSLGTDDWLEGLACSPGLIVAAGDNGAIYTSANGTNWVRRPAGVSDWLRGVAHGSPGGGSLFVAVGENGAITTSTNGVQWTAATRFTTVDLNRVAWVNNQFWVVGNSGLVFVSANGRAWSAVNTGATRSLYTVAGFNGSVLVAGDEELRLREGTGPWINQLDPAKLLPAAPWIYLSALHDGKSYLVAGRTGVMTEGFKSESGGETLWLPLDSSPRRWLWDVKRFPGLYLAVGDQGAILSSIKGADWSEEIVPASATASVLLGIGGRTNLAVAVGSLGTILWSDDSPTTVVNTNSNGMVVTNEVSSLGIVWHAIEPRPALNDLQGVCAFGDQFIATGAAGLVLSSPDAATWSTRTTPVTAFLSSVDANALLAVAVGQNGVILTSTNAIQWTQRPSGTTSWIYRVRWLEDRWTAVGQNGVLLVSTNGLDWAPRPSGTTQWLNAVARAGDRFVAVGTQGTVILSTNGFDWVTSGTISAKSLYGAATSGHQLVVTGLEGVILRTSLQPQLSPVSLLQYPAQPAHNVFLFSGELDQRFTLDRSTNLVDWATSALLEFTTSDETIIHVDPGVNEPDRQFFRARPQP